MRLIPSRVGVLVIAAAALCGAIALGAGVARSAVDTTLAAVAIAGLLWAVIDLVVSFAAWYRAPLAWHRELPAAFALGVAHTVRGSLVNEGGSAWRVQLFDGVDPTLGFEGLPRSVLAAAHAKTGFGYRVTPHRRGPVVFAPAELRVRTRLGCFDMRFAAGTEQALRVYPNFAAVARYAWLAGDHRLAEIGIKTAPQRGAGTDFKQLAEYRPGDPVRHIDWKATLRHAKPIVREFQDERDQTVLFLLDCGRRMRADEGAASKGGSHFDEALNALMLLAHVALKEGDAVGAMTFGTAPDDARLFAPRKGHASLNALVAALYDIEPRATHSDYLVAATELIRKQRKRALVVVLTNFRDEDVPELEPALRLLRTRHLVLLASLRERVLREIAEQPLKSDTQAIEVAGAHLFAQARSDAFARLAARDALLIDVEPARLPAELVNRYRAVKRSGLL
jgi:uncharacterized protein (DUF58 family)